MQERHRRLAQRSLQLRAVIAGSLLGMGLSALLWFVMIVAVQPLGHLPVGVLLLLLVIAASALGELGLLVVDQVLPLDLPRSLRRVIRSPERRHKTVRLIGTGAKMMETPRGTIILMSVHGDPCLISYPGTLPAFVRGGTLEVYGRTTGFFVAAEKVNTC